MAENEGQGVSSQSSTGPSTASHLPWHLIPSFEPGETDLTEYTRRLEFLAGIWPVEHLNQLAPRAALQCKGSAFQKVVRIQPDKLKVNELSGVQLLVSTLGGVWGKTTLEDKYEKFERAIYGLSQRSDESNESYMARHEIVFEDMISQGASLSDVRAYILLRNSALSAEDKKRVVIEAKGNLKYESVTQAIRMLGAKFFLDVQGQTKSFRGKTYEVNHVQEMEEENFYHDDSNYVFSAETSDVPDSVLELLLAEGDEDAMVAHQFEEALIDTMQNDPEMTALMGTYLDARRKLTEKSKNRGFWPIRSKGVGKKGKFKMSNFRSRKPLAVRIAESECRNCGQKGHWKAECPKRFSNQSAVGSSKPQPTNMLISASGLDDEDEDGFLMEPTGSVLSDVFVVSQDPGVIKRVSHSQNCFVSWSHKGKLPYKGQFYKQVCQRLEKLFKGSANAHPSRMTPSEPLKPCETPSEKADIRDCQSRSALPRPDHADPLPKPDVSPKDVTSSMYAQPCETMFATAKTLGILDLGASQTVMGRHQLDDFLRGLPEPVRSKVFEQPVEMSFRFGNNSVVPCNRAIFVPIDKFWIKIAIVESRTPFLISNNVCRSLGAIIDTNNQSIRFQRLNCELPLQLSGRKLFLLDFCDLAAQRPPQTQMMPEKSVVAEDRIFSCLEDQDSQGQSWQPEHAIETHEMCHTEAATEIQKHETCHMTSNLASVPQSCPARAQPANEETHGESVPCRPIPDDSGDAEQAYPGRSPDVDEFRGSGPAHHPFWGEQVGPTVQRSCQGGSKILSMVHPKVCGIEQARASRVPALSQPLCGEKGDRAKCAGPSSTKVQGQAAHQNQGWHGPWEPIQWPIDDRFRSRGRVMGSDQCTGLDRREPELSASGCDRGCTLSDHEPTPSTDTSDAEFQPCIADHATTLMLQRCLEEIQHASLKTDPTYLHDHESHHKDYRNEVFDEILLFGKHHGFLDANGKILMSQYPLIDCLEVYCSDESQLTQQCRQQGLRAMRFTLKDGDLGTWEGRQKLYHVIFRYRPRNIWASPRCKAWCKWNQFNASKSTAAAQKVMLAREGDEVHLQLCEAMFLHQHQMGPAFHFHLEQPVGSDMLYEAPMQSIVECLNRSRCDLCHAGNLKHPASGKYLQKGTQIFSSSLIMSRSLEQLRCPRNHEHDHVAGSFVQNNGQRCLTSEFTELYTKTFGRHLAKAMKASHMTNEKALGCPLLMFHSHHAERSRPEDVESDVKRRRLNAKTTNPAGYPEAAVPKNPDACPAGQVMPPIRSPAELQQEILMKALKIAPRVGKVILERGELLEELQMLFPEYRIRVVELCKGTDRLRRPPVRLIPQEAPWRLSLGLHRHQLEPVDLGPWMQWQDLSNRQLCSKSPPLRLLVSVFAQQVMSNPSQAKVSMKQRVESMSPEIPRETPFGIPRSW